MAEKRSLALILETLLNIDSLDSLELKNLLDDLPLSPFYFHTVGLHQDLNDYELNNDSYYAQNMKKYLDKTLT